MGAYLPRSGLSSGDREFMVKRGDPVMVVSTPVLWLLLFLVVFAVVLGVALSRTEFTTRKISMIGVMAALSFVAYEFFRIPTPSGSSFHLGNTFTALTALLLDGVSGGLAGAIGLALADIVAGDPGYAITTFVLKFIIGIVCGTLAHKVFHLHDLDGAGKSKARYMTAVVCSSFSGLLVNVFTDPFLGYFRNRYLFGQTVELASVVAKVASGVTLVNSLMSTACAVVLYLALYPALKKARLLPGQKSSRLHAH